MNQNSYPVVKSSFVNDEGPPPRIPKKGDDDWKDYIKKNRKIIYIKKNLLDPTAALSYDLGVSIIHFGMLISINFVKDIDMEKAMTLNEAC